MENEKKLLDFLEGHHIPYRTYYHQPVFTVFEDPIITSIDGTPVANETIPPPHFKTLFLKDHKGAYFLLTLFQDKRVDIKALRKTLTCGSLSFGKEEDLLSLLRVTPGSVTPFGLLFDKENKVTFALDEESLSYESVSFHPLRNDQTLYLARKDFLRCMELMQHPPKIIPIPTTTQ